MSGRASAKGPFRTVAFDLFDTLVDFDPTRLPEVDTGGKMERTTTRPAYDALYEGGYALPHYPAFHLLWLDTSRQVWADRDNDPECREVASTVRFRRLMDRMVSIPAAQKDEAAALARESHMEALIGAALFDPARFAMLDRIREGGLRMGVVTNFDHTPAAHRLLERRGIAPYLDVVLVSEEEGYRKPSPRLFLKAAERLGAAPGEVLFVGDTFTTDVVGPQKVGMPCAWLNPKGGQVPEGCRPPDFEIRKVEETLRLLGLC
ncbi:MAG: HAD family hydrolase [Nitrospinota bacterium]